MAASNPDWKDEILAVLRQATKPLKKDEVAKKVGKMSGKDVNKYLYKLKDEGKAKQLQKEPPLWASTDASFGEQAGAGRIDGDSPCKSGGSSSNANDVIIEEDTRVASLPYGFLEAAGHLVVGHTLSNGWEKFAGEVGYSLEDIALFRSKGGDNPVKTLITDWQTKREATFGRFIQLMTSMNRADVLGALQKKLEKQICPHVKNLLEQGIKSVEQSTV